MNRELPPLNALKAFEAAARLQSISLAAKELYVTHGAVSRQIRALEEQLAVTLFVKDGRGVKLTDAGSRLRDAAFDAFERLRTACADIQRQYMVFLCFGHKQFLQFFKLFRVLLCHIGR